MTSEGGTRLGRWLRRSFRKTKSDKKGSTTCGSSLDPSCISSRNCEDSPKSLPLKPRIPSVDLSDDQTTTYGSSIYDQKFSPYQVYSPPLLESPPRGGTRQGYEHVNANGTGTQPYLSRPGEGGVTESSSIYAPVLNGAPVSLHDRPPPPPPHQTLADPYPVTRTYNRLSPTKRESIPVGSSHKTSPQKCDSNQDGGYSRVGMATTVARAIDFHSNNQTVANNDNTESPRKCDDDTGGVDRVSHRLASNGWQKSQQNTTAANNHNEQVNINSDLASKPGKYVSMACHTSTPSPSYQTNERTHPSQSDNSNRLSENNRMDRWSVTDNRADPDFINQRYNEIIKKDANDNNIHKGTHAMPTKCHTSSVDSIPRTMTSTPTKSGSSRDYFRRPRSESKRYSSRESDMDMCRSSSSSRITPLQIAMNQNTMPSIPLRSVSPSVCLSKEQIFNLYKSYKRDGLGSAEFQVERRTQSQPVLDMYSYTETTDSELDSVMMKLRTISPESPCRNENRRYIRSRSTERKRRSLFKDNKFRSMSPEGGETSDRSLNSRCMSEPVKTRSQSLDARRVSNSPKKYNSQSRERPQRVIRKSSSCNRIHSSHQDLMHCPDCHGTKPAHVRRNSQPCVTSTEDERDTLVRSSSESSLSCLSSSEEEDEDDDMNAKRQYMLQAAREQLQSNHQSSSHPSSVISTNLPPGHDGAGALSQAYDEEGRQLIWKRWWSTLGDIVPNSPLPELAPIPSSRNMDIDKDVIQHEEIPNWGDVSMATTASYVPGVSLADKLRLAASKGQLDKVKELIAAGATYEPDREGRTALHYAALNGFAECVQLLAVEAGGIDVQDNLGYTALHRAAAQGHLEVIKVLVAEGCLLDKQDEVHGNSALHEAAWNGYSKSLELLVTYKAHVNIINKAGFSALHLAAQNGHNQSARVLLYAGISCDHKNNYGDTPLHTAGRYGHAGVTRILISARCNIDEVNKNGDTGLHICSALKRRKIAKLLLDAGVDTAIRNKQNETAGDVARRKDHPEILMLIQTQAKIKPKKVKKNKKSEKQKMLEEIENEEKKEKKGFFFRKKKHKEVREVKTDLPLKTVVPVAPSAVASIAAPSEISSSPYNDGLTVEQMHHFNQFQQRGRMPMRLGSTTGQRGAGPGPSCGSTASSKVQGLLSQYSAHNGVQYYRDLAGNVRQGPVGYTPVCQCGPRLKQIETQASADRANLYDHVEGTSRALGERVSSVERRLGQQIAGLDRLTTERIEAAKRERDEAIRHRALQDRLEHDHQLEDHSDALRTEIKAWVDARMHTLEQRVSQDDSYCRHRRDRYQSEGRLYRSKSDDALSVSSSRPGGSTKSRNNVIRHLKKLNQQNTDKSNKDNMKRERTLGDGGQRPMTYHQDMGEMRTPDGRSFTERLTYGLFQAGNLQGKTSSPAESNQSGGGRLLNITEEDSPHNLSDTCIMLHRLNNSGDPGDSGCSTNQCPSPLNPADELIDPLKPMHGKTDSGSNPDSGYGSKIYNRPGSGKSDSTDQHDHSIATTEGSQEGDPLHLTRHFFNTVSTQMEQWYTRRLQEVEKRAEEKVRQESQAMESRIQHLEKKVNKDKVAGEGKVQDRVIDGQAQRNLKEPMINHVSAPPMRFQPTLLNHKPASDPPVKHYSALPHPRNAPGGPQQPVSTLPGQRNLPNTMHRQMQPAPQRHAPAPHPNPAQNQVYQRMDRAYLGTSV